MSLHVQVADMLPAQYMSMCEAYKAAFNRLLAEPHDDDDPVFVHRTVLPHADMIVMLNPNDVLHFRSRCFWVSRLPVRSHISVWCSQQSCCWPFYAAASL